MYFLTLFSHFLIIKINFLFHLKIIIQNLIYFNDIHLNYEIFLLNYDNFMFYLIHFIIHYDSLFNLLNLQMV